jgi:TPP-dependent 2-oxoacid decarboxylase
MNAILNLSVDLQTLMGLGAYPQSRQSEHGMLGMHGTVSANAAVDEADLLLAIGVRFDDRVTGKLETFAARARIVHIDIDPAEIHKNKAAHVPVRILWLGLPRMRTHNLRVAQPEASSTCTEMCPAARLCGCHGQAQP